MRQAYDYWQDQPGFANPCGDGLGVGLRSDVSEVRFLPGPRRADVLETGDIGGDKLSGLPHHVGEPRRADVLCGEHLGLPRQTLADSKVCLGRLTC